MGIQIIAGQKLHASIEAQRDATVPKSGAYFQSEPLCEFHHSLDRRGILGAQLVKSIYGWSVRYDSGLQNFGIIAGSRSGQLDGTYEDAVRYAQYWVDLDPTRRYVSVSDFELNPEYLKKSA